MRTAIVALLILAAHFNLTPFAPSAKGWFLWPFSTESKPILPFIGGLPQQFGGVIIPVLAGIAGLCFIAALLSIFGLWIPVAWFKSLVLVGSSLSIILYVLYISPWSIIPLLIDVVLIWGILSKNWSSNI